MPPLRPTAWIIIAILGLSLSLRAELVPREQGMQATLQEAMTAYERGDYARAAEAFAYTQATYGQEDAYRDLELQLLPYWGHACRQSGNSTQAIELFEAYLTRADPHAQHRHFVTYQLAEAYQTENMVEQAAATYQRYRAHDPYRPEALVSVLREAELYLNSGQTETGIQLLLSFANSPQVPRTLRAQARLRAVQATQAIGDDTRAADILLSAPWAIDTMPELAVLAFSALRAGDALMRELRTADAILAYRLVPPHSQLVTLQQARLQQLEQIRQQRLLPLAQSVPAFAFWQDYFTAIIASVQSQLEALRSMEDYTPGWQLRLGQAFLRDARPREATLLFRLLAEDNTLPTDIRTNAFYCWAMAQSELEQWDKVVDIAKAFQQIYPKQPLLAQTSYLAANAYQQQEQHSAAIEVLDWLIQSYPEHREQPRWRFTRGLNSALAQDYPAAREAFSRCLELYPNSHDKLQVKLWLGLCWFFPREYKHAISVLDPLLAEAKGHPLEAEIAYRRAMTLYAMAEYISAIDALNWLISDFPDAPQTLPAQVLLGDALMGTGDYQAASEQFSNVPDTDPALYAYAVFQQGKIFRAQQNYPAMIAHFRSYAESSALSPRPRLAEALYWAGWGLAQAGKPEQARQLFVETFARYGNDPQAGEMGELLHALGKQDIWSAAGTNARVMSYETWLEQERAAARESGEFTRYSRLSLASAALLRDAGKTNKADNILYDILEIAPPEQIDAKGLTELGWLLTRQGFSHAEELFSQQLEMYPKNRYTGRSLYGLGTLAASQQNYTEAEQWLARFQAETPYQADAAAVALLRAEVLLQLGQPAEAMDVCEELLTMKAARGRPHAEALLLMATISQEQGETTKAIAYAQRVYTLYRAYPDLLSRAYWQSAQWFLKLGDMNAAKRTLVEMTTDPRLDDFSEHDEALALLEELTQREPVHHKIEVTP